MESIFILLIPALIWFALQRSCPSWQIACAVTVTVTSLPSSVVITHVVAPIDLTFPSSEGVVVGGGVGFGAA